MITLDIPSIAMQSSHGMRLLVKFDSIPNQPPRTTDTISTFYAQSHTENRVLHTAVEKVWEKH